MWEDKKNPLKTMQKDTQLVFEMQFLITKSFILNYLKNKPQTWTILFNMLDRDSENNMLRLKS